jgi:hypothetical protein
MLGICDSLRQAFSIRATADNALTILKKESFSAAAGIAL